MTDSDLKEKTKELIGEEKAPNEIDIFWASTAYIIFFLPLFSKHYNNDFVRYHMRQGLALFLVFVASTAIAEISGIFFLKVILNLAVFFLWCLGETYVLLGRKEHLPITGWLVEKIFMRDKTNK